jgi:hypothetical protein
MAALLAALLAVPLVASPIAAQDLVAADAAFMQQRFPDAAAAYRTVLANGTLDDRKKAALGVAVIDWKIDGDTARAMRDLLPFIRSSKTLTLMSRARLDARNVAGARTAARAAIAAAHDSDERQDAVVALADAASFPYERWCLDSAGPRPRARDDSTVRSAIVQLRAIAAREPGHIDPSERLVRLAAITGDWRALALGWRSYYVVGRRVANGPLVRAEAELQLMQNASGANKGSHAFAALVDSKLFEPAALIAACGARVARGALAHDALAHDAHTAEIVAYARFLRDVGRVTDAYYQTVARGHGDASVWKAHLDEAGKRLWPRLVWNGSPPAYSLDSLKSDLDRRFSLVSNAGRTAGVTDLHSGHRISSEDREVSQYGRHAHIRFDVLDGMVSNGYQSWAWDGRAAHGGWASDVVIVQVRPRYADGPLKAWRAISDPATAARDAKVLAADSAADIERARKSEIGYFPGVEGRLLRNARLALRDSLVRSGVPAQSVGAAFAQRYGEEVDESSIFAHEGRHAIDRGLHLADSTPANLEYRAKLSEIAFAPSPTLALSSILSSTTGDETPHGIADARFLRGLLDWMRKQTLSGAASDTPLVLRIPELSDEQIRDAARSLDPFAAGDSTAGPGSP